MNNTIKLKIFLLILILLTAGMTPRVFGYPGDLVTTNIIDLGGANESLNSLYLNADGTILGAGTTDVNGNSDMLVARFLSDGTFDHSFGNNGWNTADISLGNDTANWVTSMLDGMIVLAGFTDGGTQLVRVLSMASFNINGQLSSHFGPNGDGTSFVCLDSKGIAGTRDVLFDNLLITGDTLPTSFRTDTLLTQVFSDGTVDTNFGNNTGCEFKDNVVDFDDYGLAVYQDPNNFMITVVSTVYAQSSGWGIFLNRYNQDGTVDTTFGDNGTIHTHPLSITGTPGEIINVTAATFRNNGKIIVTGKSRAEKFLMQYNADGTHDTGFGSNNGVEFVEIPGGVHALTVDERGFVVMAGSYSEGGNDKIMLARFTDTGTLNKRFGDDGVVFADLLGTISGVEVSKSISVLQNSNIVVSGKAGNDAFLAIFEGGIVNSPKVDIKVNLTDGPVSILKGELIEVGITLKPMMFTGNSADWWVYAISQSDTFWFRRGSLQPSSTPVRAYGGPLFKIPYRSAILDTNDFPAGDYVFNFSVDDNMDNVQDNTYMDSVSVICRTCRGTCII